MKLSELQTGQKGVIVKVMGRGVFRRRITEMGFIRGKEVQVIQNAPLKDPIQYRILGYDVSLRRNDAQLIEVVTSTEEMKHIADSIHSSNQEFTFPTDELRSIAIDRGKTINVALIGNPNSGKTSLFNFASGSHEHVGNYSGVTVDAKDAIFKQNGYTFKIVDLPGTYSISCSSAEEIYVRRYLNEDLPDVVINVVDASNLERNLYLTCQLIDKDVPVVIALNMFDSLEKHGDKFDYESLAQMIGIPIIPTNGRTGKGIENLFSHVIRVYEETEPIVRHIHINYGETLENAIRNVRNAIRSNTQIGNGQSKRYLAIKLLEQDCETEEYIRQIPGHETIIEECNKNIKEVEELLKTDTETAFADARYGFISGALRETFKPNKINEISHTQVVDSIVTHKLFGFPIFLLFMWIMFEATFQLGEYPKAWIESFVGWCASLVQNWMPDGPFKDLLADGIIGGVGGVISFLPNILILYAFISLMEDSGYMARAAFIMDKIMHKMGIHGKSFIPLIMGFGCNVPAIMATRTIESRSSRMITMLINPFMSCTARLPVYVLLIQTFFPDNEGTMLFLIYGVGILLAVILARIFKRFLFNQEDVPFVMELPPYRVPTGRSIGIHMWDKSRQYLRKMGGVILIASIIIWFLGYFPTYTEQDRVYDYQISQIEQSQLPDKKEQVDELIRLKAIDHQENSYIGQIGRTIEPVLKPLGFDWKISVSILTGMAAKEVVVSTLGILYTGEETDDITLGNKLKESKDAAGNPTFTPLVALSLMLFVLIYFPCIATVVAIAKESKSWKWGLFVIVYSCILAWIVSFSVYQIGSLFV